MKAIGLPEDLIQKMQRCQCISEIEEPEDNFKVSILPALKVFVFTFTIGKEAERRPVHCEGNKLKVSLKDIDSVTELLDTNKIVITLSL